MTDFNVEVLNELSKIILSKKPIIFTGKDKYVQLELERLTQQALDTGVPKKQVKTYILSEVCNLFSNIDLNEKYDPSRCSFSHYVNTMLYFKLLDFKRGRAKDANNNPVCYSPCLVDFNDKDASSSAENKLYEKELFPLLKEYFGEEYFELQLKGFKPIEIAKELGLTSSCVRTYLYRKRLGLIKFLKKHGFNEKDLPKKILNRLKTLTGAK